MLAVHLDGTFFGTRAAARSMAQRGSGAIVNIASVCGIEGCVGYPHYSAAKAGMLGFTRAVAKELHRPGDPRQRGRAGLHRDGGIAALDRARCGTAQRVRTPLGRFGRQEEIAATVAFLASGRRRVLRRRDAQPQRRHRHHLEGGARMEGREVVIVEAVRTPIGRGHPEKGYYQDVHPNELLGATLRRGAVERAGVDPREVEDVIAGCVQQYGEQSLQHRPQRLAAGRAAGRDAGDDDRPPVRLGAAGGQLRRGAGREPASTTSSIGGGVEHMGHVPLVRRREAARGARRRRSRRSCSTATTRPPGPQRRADRRAVGRSRARSATRSRCARSSAPHARRRRAGSSARSSRSRSNGDDRHDRPGHPAGDDARGARRAEAGVQGGRRRSRPATRRRSPTAPPRCC